MAKDVFDFLPEMDVSEQEELCGKLLRTLGSKSKQDVVSEYLQTLPPFELKRIFVNMFGIPNYYDDDALRKALEPIITAR